MPGERLVFRWVSGAASICIRGTASLAVRRLSTSCVQQVPPPLPLRYGHKPVRDKRLGLRRWAGVGVLGLLPGFLIWLRAFRHLTFSLLVSRPQAFCRWNTTVTQPRLAVACAANKRLRSSSITRCRFAFWQVHQPFRAGSPIGYWTRLGYWTRFDCAWAPSGHAPAAAAADAGARRGLSGRAAEAEER